MKKTLRKILVCLCLCALLLPGCLTRAEAADLDYIDRCDMTVQPSGEDGSLLITAAFRWTVLDQGPVKWLQIGIPNGSVRETNILSDNINELSYDNSYMYVYFNEAYDNGATFEFSYSWVQEYMYTLGADGTVSYTYTPGWFDEAQIGEMTVTWRGLSSAGGTLRGSFSGVEGTAEPTPDGGVYLTAQDLPHGAQMTVTADYTAFPASLSADMSAENVPQDSYGNGGYPGDEEYSDSGFDAGSLVITIVIILLVIFVVVAKSSDGYRGGFGNTYIFYNGLWYPRGPGDKPRPGSVGTPHKPTVPPRSGGFGGGSRGGGFGGGGFGGGGGHCACASSCACACACACAGGGRAGCSAKNLYGAVRLSRQLTAKLSARTEQNV